MTESERNLKGQELEKAGDIEQAILLYEKNVDLGSAAAPIINHNPAET